MPFFAAIGVGMIVAMVGIFIGQNVAFPIVCNNTAAFAAGNCFYRIERKTTHFTKGA